MEDNFDNSSQTDNDEKKKAKYVCPDCGANSDKSGECPDCGGALEKACDCGSGLPESECCKMDFDDDDNDGDDGDGGDGGDGGDYDDDDD